MTPTPDLHRLNDAERRVLALLAQGHTAKSIAAATGSSEGSVNERLREARRKTGVGSSRELARLLSAQKDRDQEIGMVVDPGTAPAPGSAPRPARWQGKVLLMTIPIIAVAAIAVALHVPDPQAAPAPAPQASFATSGDGDADVEAAKVQHVYAGEARNAAWADGTEALLRGRYHAVRGVDAATLRITCRTSWCEVSGRSAPGLALAPGRHAAEELASPALRNSLSHHGLHADVTSLSSHGISTDELDKGFQFEFLAYWHRVSG